MFEKVNPSHPDKLAVRIAGAIVDMAYMAEPDPRMAVEVLLGHGACHIICESSVTVDDDEVASAVRRITGIDAWDIDISQNRQDHHLSDNQANGVRCGDNGIFRGCPVTVEQRKLSEFMRELYEVCPYDGKAIACADRLTLCQSNMDADEMLLQPVGYVDVKVNPLGSWSGGPDVDAGATNRKLGSDMGDAVTGGGLHGKDLSKADVSVNIACHILAQREAQNCVATCAIGDDEVRFVFEYEEGVTMPYHQVVEMAREYVASLGGFEGLAEWGLI